MEYAINSRKFGLVRFQAVGPGDYVRIVIETQEPQQIFKHGSFMGSALSAPNMGPESQLQEKFEAMCKRWWRKYLQNLREHET